MRFTEIFEAIELKEATNYEQLFDPVFNLYNKYEEYIKHDHPKNEIQMQIKQTIQNTKSEISQGRPGFQNWILYVLKLERMYWLRFIMDEITDETELDPKTTSKMKKYFQYGFSIDFPRYHSLTSRIRLLKTKFQHYSSYNYEPLKKYIPNDDPDKVLFDMEKLEKEYFDKIGDEARFLTLEDGDKIIKDFGDGFVWVMLGRGACEAEGDAMGHCGNVPQVQSGDRIISFRKKRKINNDTFYEPFMTFIYNEQTKELGERKGRNNEKPVPKYHPYIIELLKMNFIEGLNNEGYIPEENFALDDLTQEQREEVFASNKALMFTTGIKLKELDAQEKKEYFEKRNELFQKKIVNDSIKYDPDQDKMVLAIEIDEVIDSDLLNVVNDIFMYWNNDGSVDIDDVIQDLDETNLKMLYDYCQKIVEQYGLENFPEFEEFSKEAGRRRFTDIFREYEDEWDEIKDDELYDEMESFIRRIGDDALMKSYEVEFRDKLKSEIKDITIYEPSGIEFVFNNEFGHGVGVEPYIDGASTVLFITDTFINPSDTDHIFEQILEEKEKVKEIDDRYMSYYADAENINQMFLDFWELD